MPSRNWNDDDELMRDLREALWPDPTEQQVIDSATAAYRWGTADADVELAALLYDSDLDQSALVRGPLTGVPRTLVFGRGPLNVEIELSETGIEGQLVPPEPGVVRLVSIAGAEAETIADEVGCFSFPAGRRGPIRLECTLQGGRFATAWIVT
ncbi:hypothetical protein [Phytohabitans rumicis]|uniref:Uncharacterized protein n=1 Tax=Phytohabitans rumicis TaxID=1076125 RepID=A0A6V8LE35_9ACTN|nr:hypothetical protein [Phytohabitans rumicis]GFJ95502.1 hypothetical protein Prum_091440 [Phytohabitans rumicis]